MSKVLPSSSTDTASFDGTVLRGRIISGDVSDHTHTAAEIISGTMATARLGSGTADSTTFLRGDSTWITLPDENTTYTAGDFLTLTGTDFDVDVKDEDNMASDSATHLATQQSIKAYVDTLETKVDGLNLTLIHISEPPRQE